MPDRPPHPRSGRHPRLRHALALGSGLLLALWPAWAAAECGPLDAGGCMDGALYRFWEGIAGLGWWIDRTLLMGAAQIDTLRWWMVEVAFTSAYQALVATLSPLLAPIAVVAIMVGCLFFLLLPILGRTSVVNIRHALIWAVVGPLLLTISGPLIVQVELARSQVGSALYDAVGTIAPGAIFGAPGSDMQTASPLYPAAPCGVALTRRSGTGMRLDDLAAALVWADAGDIHCPEARGPSRDIPDGFFEAAPSGAGYAVDSDVSLMPPGTPRSEAVRNIQRGAIRTFVAILPAVLAMLDALVQLLFALALVALWVSLPIGLLFVGFQQHAGTVTGIFRRMLVVLQVSWSTSVLMGLLVACLVAAAELRNAAAYTGFAIGGGALVLYLLRVAVDTFVDALRTLSSTAATVTGLSAAQAVASTGSTLASAGATGAALAAGGLTTGLVATMAYQQTGSGQYAAAAALGRFRPLAEVGEVAAAVGVIDHQSELASGLYAGSRSERNLRTASRQMRTDAARTDDDGRTFRERAQERQIARQFAADVRPTIVEEVAGVTQAGRQAYDYVGSAQMAVDVGRLGDRIPTVATVADGWERMRGGWREIQRDAQQLSNDSPNLLVQTAATIQVLDARLRPGGGKRVAQLDARGQVGYTAAPEMTPAHALQAPADEVNLPRLLTLGYVVQEQGEQVVFWRAEPPANTDTPTRGSQRRSRLGRGADAPEQLPEQELLRRSGALRSPPTPATTQSAAPAVAPSAAPPIQGAAPTAAPRRAEVPDRAQNLAPAAPADAPISVWPTAADHETEPTLPPAEIPPASRATLEAALAATNARIDALQLHVTADGRQTRTPRLDAAQELLVLQARARAIRVRLATMPADTHEEPTDAA